MIGAWRPRLPGTARRTVIAVALSLPLVAAALPAAAYDPGRPTSDRGAAQPGGKDGSGPRRTVALGLATPDGRSLQALDGLSQSIGRKPAIWAIWSQWGNGGSRSFPMAMARALRERNIQPFIWWEPVDPADLEDGTYPRHRNITAGDHDAYIRSWARDAKAFGGKVLLRFAHEMNNQFFPWSINRFDNSPATFVAAWRHVYDIFQAEGATNVKFVWSVNKQTCPGGCNPYHDIYPGDAYVDIMGFTGYNWGAHPGKTWKSMLDSFRMVTRKLGEVSSKPIIVSETASNVEGGDKAAWIREGYAEVYRELPQIKAIVWLNADLRGMGHPDWRVSSGDGSLAAYAEIAALPEFDARAPFREAIIAPHTKARAGADRGDRARQTKRRLAKSDKDALRSAKQTKVRQGSAVNEARDPARATARKGKNASTRPPRKQRQDEEQPQVLDTFRR